jgi:golgi phosphoprotein 3
MLSLCEELLLLTIDDHKGVIPYSVYPQQNASAKYWIKHQLRAVVMANEKAETRTLILLSLLKACRLLNLVFTKDERKAAANQIDELVKGEVLWRCSGAHS